MNGRMYDAWLGRFLSPDNFVQTPDDSQNLNRYSYALNNPLVFTDPSGNYNFKVNQPTQQELLSGYISMFTTAALGYFFPPLAIVQGGAFGSMLGYAVPRAISGFIGGFIGSSTSSWIYGGSLSAGLGSGSVAGMYGMFNGFEMGASEGLYQYYSRPLLKVRLPEVDVVPGTGKVKGGVPSCWGKFGDSVDGDDGYSLLVKLFMHYQFGGETDYNINSSTLDFSGTSQSELGLTGIKVGESREVNLFNAGITTYSLAFGKLTMTYQGNNQFSIESNKFDFDYQPNSSFGRNMGTFIGGAVFGQFYTIPITPFGVLRNVTRFGGSFMINFYGTVTIPQ